MTKPRVSLGRGPALWGEGGCSGSTGTAPGGQHHGAWHRTRLHGNTTLPPEEKIHTGKKKTQKTKNLPPPKKKIPQQTTTKKMYYINRRLQEPLLPDPTLQHDGKRTLPFWPNTIRHRNVLDMTVLYPW